MPDQTKDVLKKLSETMRRAAGLQATPASAARKRRPPRRRRAAPPDQKAKPARRSADRRAEVPGAGPSHAALIGRMRRERRAWA